MIWTLNKTVFLENNLRRALLCRSIKLEFISNTQESLPTKSKSNKIRIGDIPRGKQHGHKFSRIL